jgi:malonyl-CoA O-methyltransferase
VIPEKPAAAAADEPFYADRAALKRNFGRAAATLKRGDALYREVGSRMLERLGYIKLAPARVLDLGCASGGALPGLRERYPHAQLLALDFAMPMLRAAIPPAAAWHARVAARLLHKPTAPQALQADMARLPLAAGAVDLVWSNLALHWLDDPLPAIREANRALSVGGLFMFSTLGPDTLMELRDAFASARGPAGAPGWRVKRFIDLHDIGDALVGAGFTTPVMDMEKLTLTYASVGGLYADLRSTGAVNAMRGRARGLAPKGLMARVQAAYEGRRGQRADARLPATFEVIYGHAWKGQPRRTAAGETVVNFVPGREQRGRRPR